ncbi:hypothetical protein THAOC_18528, partial [Thalassiosira oceanica]
REKFVFASLLSGDAHLGIIYLWPELPDLVDFKTQLLLLPAALFIFT